ncbi:Sulfotransferase [Euzebya pacifica]|uniref:Sulfotransferase n=1 Tax=Euzebya pacifica TaxID=1608957 RepID=A0A346XRU9_9ACTN|nr:sulfotransferase domain-containing protein [Euzebya pacifica]AXV04946.1 Sulfotransferase [Euzebya pacifica]
MGRPRYRSRDEDSSRWGGLSRRDGDIVVSTRTKHGTTWAQAILLHLIHGPDLPAPLPVVSPWIDHLVEPLLEVLGRLEAQEHRRVIKTHTPLDGLPWREGLGYVVVARHPLDAATSLFHHIRNLDRRRMAELAGQPVPAGRPVVELGTWLSRWVVDDADPRQHLDSLNGVAHHLIDAWQRREEPNVVLVRYADLVVDRRREVERLAVALDLPLEHVDCAVEATSLEAMRDNAHRMVPDPVGIILDPSQFFRGGRVGDGRRLDPRLVQRYEERAAELFPPDLLEWLHGGEPVGDAPA